MRDYGHTSPMLFLQSTFNKRWGAVDGAEPTGGARYRELVFQW